MNGRLPKAEIEPIMKGALRLLHANADVHRRDRLFPASPAVYLTNPLSVSFGAAGVALALQKLEGEVDGTIKYWMLSQPVTSESYPPGLYVGSSGIAWAFWELGFKEVALRLLREAGEHPLLWELPDVFYGAAGYGLACLKFHTETGEPYWLDQAVQVGERLLASRIDRGGLCCWADAQGGVWSGYARGSSGIALFLLYLAQVTGEERFMSIARRGMDFDLTHEQQIPGGPASIRRGREGDGSKVVSHYWLDGTAGVCTALVRFWAVTQDAGYRETLERLAVDCHRKYTSFPGLFRGLAGLGNLLLDLYQFTGEERYLDQADLVTRGVALYRIEMDDGIAFPGEQLNRAALDFGTGSAGVLLYLNRYLNAQAGSPNFNFLADELLQPELPKLSVQTERVAAV